VPMWLTRQVDVLTSLVPAMCVGMAAAGVCVLLGWWIGRYRSFAIVRLVGWWISRVVLPILRSPSWAARASTIAANNLSACALLIVMGTTFPTAWLGVIGLGLSLGIAVRALSADEIGDASLGDNMPDRNAAKMVVGMTLNMLEPPAIVIAVGLCLGQRAMPAGVAMRQAWESFAICVVPALLLAGAGEALWLGARGRSR